MDIFCIFNTQSSDVYIRNLQKFKCFPPVIFYFNTGPCCPERNVVVWEDRVNDGERHICCIGKPLGNHI